MWPDAMSEQVADAYNCGRLGERIKWMHYLRMNIIFPAPAKNAEA